jgi:hypothetical protein
MFDNIILNEQQPEEIMPSYLSIGADVLQQIICIIRIRRAPTRHDNIDIKPIVKRKIPR